MEQTDNVQGLQPVSPIKGAIFKEPLETMLASFKIACEWLTEIGIPTSATRYGKYQRIFDKCFSSPPGMADLDFTEESKVAFENAYEEANELVRLHADLTRIASQEFLNQIKVVGSGQEFRANVDNDQARDFLFELSTAARFIRAGYHVALNTISDIVVTLDDKAELHVECKRLKSANRIEKNLKKAHSQLNERMVRAPKGSFGMAALDFTDLLPPRPNLVLPSFELASRQLAARLAVVLQANQDALMRVRPTPWNIGVLCSAIGMYYFTDRGTGLDGLSYARHTSYIQYLPAGTMGAAFLRSVAETLKGQDIYRDSLPLQSL